MKIWIKILATIIVICCVFLGIFVAWRMHNKAIVITSNNKRIESQIDNITNNYEKEQEKLEQARINEDGTIYFPDKNFENAIKEYLDIEKITVEQIKDVKKLDLQEYEIENIAGIEYFENIEILNLMRNSIKDISNIKNLQNLKSIFLEKNQVSKIDAVSNLSKLEILNVGTNIITDISPIKDLKNLSGLVINGNPIENYEIIYNKIDEMSINNAKFLNVQENDDYIVSQRKHDKETYQKNITTVEDMKKWTEENIKTDMSDLEKEYKIINHILGRITYAYENRASEIDLYGSYEEGRTVCFGYALIFKYLCDFSGLECYQVGSNLSAEELQQGKENHVWNIVKIDDKYYQVDLTWADVHDNYDYKYINVSNDTMEQLHYYDYKIFSIKSYPETKDDMDVNEQEKYYEF